MTDRKHEGSMTGPATKADHEHVAMMRAGSQTSWGKLYERHRRGLVRFCGNFTPDPQLAEDWAQEALVKLKENADTFHDGAELKPWLYKVARNICLKYRQKNREAQWSDSVFATQAEQLIDTGPSPASKAVREELNEDVKALLAKFSEEQRTIFTLRYVEGLSRKEIAVVMDLPEALVKSRLCHAMNTLREKLNKKV